MLITCGPWKIDVDSSCSRTISSLVVETVKWSFEFYNNSEKEVIVKTCSEFGIDLGCPSRVLGYYHFIKGNIWLGAVEYLFAGRLLSGDPLALYSPDGIHESIDENHFHNHEGLGIAFTDRIDPFWKSKLPGGIARMFIYCYLNGDFGTIYDKRTRDQKKTGPSIHIDVTGPKPESGSSGN